jgi:hypothetical protein
MTSCWICSVPSKMSKVAFCRSPPCDTSPDLGFRPAVFVGSTRVRRELDPN